MEKKPKEGIRIETWETANLVRKEIEGIQKELEELEAARTRWEEIESERQDAHREAGLLTDEEDARMVTSVKEASAMIDQINRLIVEKREAIKEKEKLDREIGNPPIYVIPDEEKN